VEYKDCEFACIAGCGRSGTHLLAYTLDLSTKIKVSIEENPEFRYAQQVALYGEEAEDEYIDLMACYKERAEEYASRGKYLIDKSHPVLWIVEDLAEIFPKMRFIITMREPLGNISSMLQHTGIRAWYEPLRITEDQICPFLGKIEENKEYFHTLDITQQLAWKWKMHNKEAIRLKQLLQDRVCLFPYEYFLAQSGEIIRWMSELFPALLLEGILAYDLGIEGTPLVKWKQNLSDKQIELIREIIGDSYYSFPSLQDTLSLEEKAEFFESLYLRTHARKVPYMRTRAYTALPKSLITKSWDGQFIIPTVSA